MEKLLKSKELKKINEIFSQEELEKMEVVKFKRGDEIEVSYSSVYLLLKGTLDFAYYTAEGKKFIFSTIVPEDFFFRVFSLFKPGGFFK